MTVFLNESNAAFLTLRPAILPNSLLIILCHPLDQFGAGRASPHPTNSVRVCRLGVERRHSAEGRAECSQADIGMNIAFKIPQGHRAARAMNSPERTHPSRSRRGVRY